MNLIFVLIVLLKSVRCYLLQALPLLNADLQLNKCDRVITAYYSRFQIEFNPGVSVAVPMSNDICHISSSYLAQCYPLMFYLNFLHSDLLLLQKCWCPDNVMHELVVTYSNKVCLCVSSIYLGSLFEVRRWSIIGRNCSLFSSSHFIRLYYLLSINSLILSIHIFRSLPSFSMLR